LLYAEWRTTRFELTPPKIRNRNKRQFLFYINPQPLNADAFEDKMFFLASDGYRVIAHDRRGHGRSSQPFARRMLSASRGPRP
jgi:pimeloyl-ACP methyl ester carboxylesterase